MLLESMKLVTKNQFFTTMSLSVVVRLGAGLAAVGGGIVTVCIGRCVCTIVGVMRIVDVWLK